MTWMLTQTADPLDSVATMNPVTTVDPVATVDPVTTVGPVTHDPLHTLERLYDGHAETMYRWAVGMLGRREEAEDAIQAVWLKLARDPERLRGVHDLPAYGWKALRHHVNSVLRRRMLERLWTPPLDEGDEILLEATDPAISDDTRRDLTRAVRRLKPRFRAIVLLVGFAGCTLEEAASRLGIPRGTAASRYHTAIRTLRRALRAGAAP